MTRNLLTRFEAMLSKDRTRDGCWIWMGSKTPAGYGMLSVNNKPTYAHRISFLLFRGEIVDQLLVCHKCDTPSCVNPEHLFLGTNADNLADMRAKGRGFIPTPPDVRGEKSNFAKLSRIEVLEIRSDARKTSAVAKAYSVSYETIWRIRTNRTWIALTAETG